MAEKNEWDAAKVGIGLVIGGVIGCLLCRCKAGAVSLRNLQVQPSDVYYDETVVATCEVVNNSGQAATPVVHCNINGEHLDSRPVFVEAGGVAVVDFDFRAQEQGYNEVLVFLDGLEGNFNVQAGG